MTPQVERVTEGAKVGEGPHWDVERQVLYFVDVPGETIFKYNPSTKKLTKASVAPYNVSFIIPVEGTKDRFVVGFLQDIALIAWNGETDRITVLDKLASTGDGTRFNDAKVDPSGKLWIGSLLVDPKDLTKSPASGTLFSLDSKKTLTPHVRKIHLSNGLAFNEIEKKFYFIDTLKYCIYQFDFDNTSGTISNQQVWFTFEKHNLEGFPDGMTIDTDGNLWVANFGGSKVLKVDGRKPENLLQSVELPALQVTSVAFGGANLDELYVTTASTELQGQKAPPPPENGATYRITGLGVKGLPAGNFKL